MSNTCLNHLVAEGGHVSFRSCGEPAVFEDSDGGPLCSKCAVALERQGVIGIKAIKHSSVEDEVGFVSVLASAMVLWDALERKVRLEFPECSEERVYEFTKQAFEIVIEARQR
jgi:hypothetical protein